jgi:hypothetical protein
MPAAPRSRRHAAAIAAIALLSSGSPGAHAASSGGVLVPATEATPRAALFVACEGGVVQLALRAAARPPDDVLLLELEGQPLTRVRARWDGDALALPAGSALQVSGWLAQSKPFALVAEAAPASPRWTFEPSPTHRAPLAELLRACDLAPPSDPDPPAPPAPTADRPAPAR